MRETLDGVGGLVSLRVELVHGFAEDTSSVYTNLPLTSSSRLPSVLQSNTDLSWPLLLPIFQFELADADVLDDTGLLALCCDELVKHRERAVFSCELTLSLLRFSRTDVCGNRPASLASLFFEPCKRLPCADRCVARRESLLSKC